MATLGELNEELQSDIEFLSARTLIGAFDKLHKELSDHVRGRDLYAERWMEEKASRVDGAAFLARKLRRT